MKTKELNSLIEGLITKEIKTTILKESEGGKEVHHITCDGEPIDTTDDVNKAQTLLSDMKTSHPGKNFGIQKTRYQSHEHMIDELDKMGEDLENKTKKVSWVPTKVGSLAEALMDAKSKNIKKIIINEQTHDVDKKWKEMEEEETACDECEIEESEHHDWWDGLKPAEQNDMSQKHFPDGGGDSTLNNKIKHMYDKMHGNNHVEPNNGPDLGKAFEKFKNMQENTKKINESDPDEYYDVKHNEDKHSKDDYDEDEEKEKRDKKKAKETIRKGADVSNFGDPKKWQKETRKDRKIDESKKRTVKLTEAELFDVISRIVKESVPGISVTKSAQTASDKVNKGNATEVGKKLKDYLSFDGNDNPEFPKQVTKGDKKAINNTPEEDEFVEDNRGGGLQHLQYENEPSEQFKKRLKMAIEGDSTMGNSTDAANVVKSDLGPNIIKQVARKLKKDDEAPMYEKEPQPVKIVKESKVSFNSLVEEELLKMKKISNYNAITQ